MKLKHIVGDNLCVLEQRLDKLGALVKCIVSVTWEGHNWFIHYIESEPEIKAEKPAGVKSASKSKTI